MFGLYPAGAQWCRQYISPCPGHVLRQRLAEVAGVEAGSMDEPFGPQRGAIIARHHDFLIMAGSVIAETEVVVVPDVQLQNLLWAFNTGHADQYSSLDLCVLTKGAVDSWEKLLAESTRHFRWTASLVEHAIANTLNKEQAEQPAQPVTVADHDRGIPEISGYDDDTWIPVDAYGREGGASCGL
jgi:hypothetical protein